MLQRVKDFCQKYKKGVIIVVVLVLLFVAGMLSDKIGFTPTPDTADTLTAPSSSPVAPEPYQEPDGTWIFPDNFEFEGDPDIIIDPASYTEVRDAMGTQIFIYINQLREDSGYDLLDAESGWQEYITQLTSEKAGLDQNPETLFPYPVWTKRYPGQLTIEELIAQTDFTWWVAPVSNHLAATVVYNGWYDYTYLTIAISDEPFSVVLKPIEESTP